MDIEDLLREISVLNRRQIPALLHQSSGGFIEDNLTGLRPDIALLYPMERNDLAEMLKMLQPKTVVVHHFDEWCAPFA
jgi:hypothetical protein